MYISDKSKSELFFTSAVLFAVGCGILWGSRGFGISLLIISIWIVVTLEMKYGKV